MPAVALAAVICSLFMGLIGAMLRFCVLVVAVGYSTEMATNLNDQENDLAGAGSQRDAESKERLDWLYGHVQNYLYEAKVQLDQLRPILVTLRSFVRWEC